MGSNNDISGLISPHILKPTQSASGLGTLKSADLGRYLICGLPPDYLHCFCKISILKIDFSLGSGWGIGIQKGEKERERRGRGGKRGYRVGGERVKGERWKEGVQRGG